MVEVPYDSYRFYLRQRLEPLMYKLTVFLLFLVNYPIYGITCVDFLFKYSTLRFDFLRGSWVFLTWFSF